MDYLGEPMNLDFKILPYLIFVFQGLTAPLGSVMIIEIARKYSVDTSMIGYVFALGIIGGGIAALASGFLLEAIGKRRLIFVGILCGGLAVLSITVSNHLTMFGMGVFLTGLSNWLLTAVGNEIVIENYQGNKRSSKLNLLNFFYSAGALVTPAMAGSMLARGIRWEMIFLTPFTLLVILALFAYFLKSNLPKVPISSLEKVTQLNSTEGWSSNMYRTSVALGIYCMLELSYTYWIVVYLREYLSIGIVEASLILTIFYICQAIGRFATGIVIKYVSLYRYIIFCSLIGLAAASLILISKSYVVILCLTILLGLAVAGLYPSILSYGTLQATHSPRVVTFFLTSGLTGSVLGMLVTSFLKQQVGSWACIVVTAVSAALVILLIGSTMGKEEE